MQSKHTSSVYQQSCWSLQERQRKQREAQVRAKVAASAFARGYLDGIVTRVFDQLADAGYFYDPVEREVSLRSYPWMLTPLGCFLWLLQPLLHFGRLSSCRVPYVSFAIFGRQEGCGHCLGFTA